MVLVHAQCLVEVAVHVVEETHLRHLPLQGVLFGDRVHHSDEEIIDLAEENDHLAFVVKTLYALESSTVNTNRLLQLLHVRDRVLGVLLLQFQMAPKQHSGAMINNALLERQRLQGGNDPIGREIGNVDVEWIF